MSATDALDVITVGRIGVDLYPEQHGVGLADVETFAKGLGGSATNVAVAAARLGRSAAVVTKVGDDAWGAYCRGALAEYGVSTEWVRTHPALRTPVTFCEVRPPDDFPLLFYREPTAPDLTVGVEDLPLDEIVRAGLVWTTGTGLSREPSRSAVLAALDARPIGALAVHDLDDRPMLWPDAAEERAAGESDAWRGHSGARTAAEPGERVIELGARRDRHADWAPEAVKRATVVVGNRAEAAVAVGDLPPREQAQALLELGPQVAIVKQGPAGVLGATRAGEVVEVPPTPVEVVCGLGAGDAFGGALCHGLLSGWPLERTLRFANAAGALVASRLLCAAAMPTRDEVEDLL